MLHGWWSLTDFNGFTGDHYMLFRYVGQNAFHITVYMDDVRESGVNRYLEEIERKEPLSIGPFDHFTIKLSRLSIKASYLVSITFISFKMPYIIFYFISFLLIISILLYDLPAPFAQYIRQGRFNKVTLHGLLM